MKVLKILTTCLMILTTQFSLSKVPNCDETTLSSELLSKAHHRVREKYGAVSSQRTYEFLLPFQISNVESLDPKPGENAITYRTRLISAQKALVAEANQVFYQFLVSNGLPQVYIPGPKNLRMYTVRANIPELEYLLEASDRCEIYKITDVVINK